jgi:ribosomal protein S18 acetylase RimI-like enzyme
MHSQVTTVRRAATSDLPALAEIDRATWSSKVTPAPKRPPGFPFSHDPNRLHDLLVAKVDGVTAGYVALHQAIPLPSHAHVLEINGMAVDPRLHGRGVGRRLLEAAKQEAVHRGARKLSLRVLAPNTPARRLYERCDFVVEGVLEAEFLLDGAPVDDILMACRLAASEDVIQPGGYGDRDV